MLEHFSSVEYNLSHILTLVTELKEEIALLMEQNVRLEIENKHLRDHLLELEGTSPTADIQETTMHLSESKLNLEKLYEEGFHVCNVFYGSHRESEEECAFCQNVIYGDLYI